MVNHGVPNHPQISIPICYNGISVGNDTTPIENILLKLYQKCVRLSKQWFALWTFLCFKGFILDESPNIVILQRNPVKGTSISPNDPVPEIENLIATAAYWIRKLQS